MGLVTKEVEVGLAATNIGRFEKLGYTIPRKIDNQGRMVVPYGTKIKVKPDDLALNSSVDVLVECDECHSIFKRSWYGYNKHLHDGKSYCNKCSKKVFCSGENNGRWNKDKTDEERINGRMYPEYKLLIRRILARDHYACRLCGETHGRLDVHHLDNYNDFVDKRLDDSNCITLCGKHHDAFHRIYTTRGNTKEQFEEWIGHPVEYLDYYNYELPSLKQVYCIEDNLVFDNIQEASVYYGQKYTTVYQDCKLHRKNKCGKHFWYVDDYEKLTPDEKMDYKNKLYIDSIRNHVVLVNTGEVFKNRNDAILKYPDATDYGIYMTCRGLHNHSGFDKNGEALKWCYLRDYNNPKEVA